MACETVLFVKREALLRSENWGLPAFSASSKGVPTGLADMASHSAGQA